MESASETLLSLPKVFLAIFLNDTYLTEIKFNLKFFEFKKKKKI